MSGLVHEAAVAATVEWYTPAWIFEDLGLEFDLDPCHPLERLPWVPATMVYTQREDGLTQPWFGRVWLNPPYGRELVLWVARQHEQGTTGVGLVFARTDTDWFAKYVAAADGVLFLRKRVQFVGRDGKPKPGRDGKVGSPGAGSMLVAWGLVEREALMAMAMRGLGVFADLS